MDMRASTLTFIFIIFEYSIITGGDGNCGDPPEITNADKVYNVTVAKFRMNCTQGYIREAGTSNLFKCINNKWKNTPSLKCILQKSKLLPTTTATTKSTSTMNGNIVSTTTNKASTTARTSSHTSQRTTTMEETSVTTSITSRITASSTTKKEKLPCAMCTTSSHNATSPAVKADKQELISSVAGGIVVIVILAVAASVAIILLRRRSRPHRAGGAPVDILVLAQGSVQPLMQNTMNSCPQDSCQSPDSSENMYTDSSLSAKKCFPG